MNSETMKAALQAVEDMTGDKVIHAQFLCFEKPKVQKVNVTIVINGEVAAHRKEDRHPRPPQP